MPDICHFARIDVILPFAYSAATAFFIAAVSGSPLRVAMAYEQATEWHKKNPPLTA